MKVGVLDDLTNIPLMYPVVQSTTDLLVESMRERAHVQVGLRCRLVDVLQTVSISVHDQTRVIVEQHADAVVTELVA